ncbi:DUF222 domain-containing protein [Mycolicibacterium sp. 050232]|uniref:DUF222 domain-containing protein n=1 Tax=Mycolicibacterium sp. 050232 TaxID=3113982 RepID=UPI002E2C0699|nr:DUF222 domain-containing protein [Mycolicibacterium sp. 050232]MED5816625.1 DUF222 domain-containing protein [Mycolicibacterium sp. 050232]
MQAHLDCRCGREDCPAQEKRAAADAAVFHVLAHQSTLDGTSNDPGYLPGYGILPAQQVRDLAANGGCQMFCVGPNGRIAGRDGRQGRGWDAG